jgi:rhodanese-related sulfurtransferase
MNVPFSELSRETPSFDATGSYLIICATGARSSQAARQLRAAGCSRAYSLSGGLTGIGDADLKTGTVTGARA